MDTFSIPGLCYQQICKIIIHLAVLINLLIRMRCVRRPHRNKCREAFIAVRLVLQAWLLFSFVVPET